MFSNKCSIERGKGKVGQVSTYKKSKDISVMVQSCFQGGRRLELYLLEISNLRSIGIRRTHTLKFWRIRQRSAGNQVFYPCKAIPLFIQQRSLRIGLRIWQFLKWTGLPTYQISILLSKSSFTLRKQFFSYTLSLKFVLEKVRSAFRIQKRHWQRHVIYYLTLYLRAQVGVQKGGLQQLLQQKDGIQSISSISCTRQCIFSKF